jgi:hypothetical protein
VTVNPLINPTNIFPATGGIQGNGITDDTAQMQSYISAGDVCIHDGTYAIYGTINIPPNRNIQMTTNAHIFNPVWNAGLSNMTFALGWSQPAHDDQIIGGNMQGADTARPTTYDPYNEYNYLVVIAPYDSGYPASTNRNITVAGVHFESCVTDCILVYAGSSSPTSGPNNVLLSDNTFGPTGYNCDHYNGGQNIVSQFNSFNGCLDQAEIDPGTGQVIKATIKNNSVVNTVGGNCGADGAHCGGAAGILGRGTSDSVYQNVNVINNSFDATGGPVGLNLFGADGSTHSGNTCVNGATGCP